MTKQNPNANVLPDPWEAMGTEYVPTYSYYGQVSISGIWMVFPGTKGSGAKPVPYNPATHNGLRPFLQIEAKLAVIPDQKLSYPMEQKWANYDQDWNKITMPSVRTLGFIRPDGKTDFQKLNGKYVSLEQVEGFSPNRNNPEKGNYKTWKFTAVYNSLEECRQAYLSEHPSADNTPAPKAKAPKPETDPMKAMALQFIETTIHEAYKNGAQYEDAYEKAKQFIETNAGSCAGLTIDSPEVRELLDQPPF